MKNAYLLYILLIALFIGGCKKNDRIVPQTNTGTDDGPTGSTNKDSIVVAALPKLLNLRINGAQCPYDSIYKVYYFPVSVGATLNNYTVNFDSTAAVSVNINGSRLKSGQVLNYPLETGQTVEIKAINSLGTPVSYNLTISGLPLVIIRMKNTNDPIDSLKRDATIDVVDPDHVAHKVDLQVHSNITIAIRGVTARYLPKKSFKVKTVDGSDVDRDLPILGLRNDEDWILDAMYIDPARMRNRLCTDLWNSFNNVPYVDQEPTALNGTRGYMTEVFINGKYGGLYCLTEKMDRKQLKVNKDYGVVYKSDLVTPETSFTGNTQYNNSLATWAGWELSYPDLGDSPAPDWSYLSNITQFIAASSDGDFKADIANRVDINNMADYFIFMNVIEATDNGAKNQYFSFYDNRSNSKFFYSPWDMDGTMARDWSGVLTSNSLFGDGGNNLLKRLIALDAGNFKEVVKARWAALKSNQLSKATVDNRIEYYRKLLVSSGAFDREYNFTYNIYTSLDEETQTMTRWYSSQYDLVDQYFNNL